MIPGQQSTVGDPGICHSHVEVEHARCPHLHGKDIIWEVSVLPERSDPCRLWLDFVSPARATERLNHSTHVHLAVQHEPSFCGVPMQSILANHIVSGGTPSSRLRNFGVRCTAATMPALPASPLCQWASGFVLGNFVVVTWSPTSSPFAAAWSSWLQGEEKGRITGPIGEPGGISDSSRGAAGEYGTNIVRI